MPAKDRPAYREMAERLGRFGAGVVRREFRGEAAKIVGEAM